ncbi:Hypothetical protein SMAX5B_018214 [Scophthalmus maximus]|uniref:Uncharacterized protein n=1 Tax=Scophthalmus maximus TaxID=52904 RepID=A0A2U9CA71_SCOMX|nr:Hypothetical protein SMAX5B_018214 [Scophthalmus maximus]
MTPRQADYIYITSDGECAAAADDSRFLIPVSLLYQQHCREDTSRHLWRLLSVAFLLLYDSKRTSSETEHKVCATILFFLFFLFFLMSLECSSVTNGNAKPRKPCISCVLAVRVRRVRLYILVCPSECEHRKEQRTKSDSSRSKRAVYLQRR